MFKITNTLLSKIAKSIKSLQLSPAAQVAGPVQFSDCPCQGQCGNTGSSAHYHCPCAANDNG